MLSPIVAELLQTKRPDSRTWTELVGLLNDQTTATEIAAIKRSLAAWPKELPRPAPKGLPRQLLPLCLDVAENEQLYHHYIAEICGSPRLRLRDGSPAVNLWRQPRGTVTLQGGSQVTLGAGQPGLADVGGFMTVEWDKYRAGFYVEFEIKIDGKIPRGAVEYRGSSVRQLSQTERDQVLRQHAQLKRGGFYCFAERVSEAVDAAVSFRNSLLEKLNVF